MSILSRFAEAVTTLNRFKGATGSLSGSGDRAFGLLSGVLTHSRNPPTRQRFDLLESYSRLPWLRSIVSRIGYAVSSTPWSLLVEVRPGPALEQETQRELARAKRARVVPEMSIGRLQRSGLKVVNNSKLRRATGDVRRKLMRLKQERMEIVEVEGHPLISLLENFNPVMTGMAAFKLTQAHLDLVGEAFWLKERDGLGNVVALWPLSPPWIEDTPRPGQGWFQISWSAWQVRIPESEMVWFCDNDPARPYWRGVGTGEALSDELETDEYAAKHTKREFFNNAVPEMLVTAEGLGEEETRRLERDWRQKNRGFFKALQVYFLNRKVDVKPLGQSFRSLQLIDLRKWERDIIIEVFGVPPEILGIVNESKRATIDAADFLFARWVLTPRLELLRSTLQERLVTEFDERLILDYETPIQEDKERQLNAAKAAPWALSVDEWRALQGHDPLPDNRGMVHVMRNNELPTTFPERDEEGETLEEEQTEVEEEPGEEEPGVAPTLPAPEQPEQPEEERFFITRNRRLLVDRKKLAEVERALDETMLIGS